MNAINQSDFLQALGWAVLNSLWQMALLWVLYQLITAVFGFLRAGQKAFFATALLFIGFGWFLFTFFTAYYQQAGTATGFLQLIDINKLHTLSINLLPAASFIYLLLLTFPFINFIRNYRYVQLIKTTGLLKADVSWRLFVKNVAVVMGVQQPVKVWLSELVTAPVTVGFLKPMIFLPLAAVNQLTPQQIEAILLHELAHIQRFDFIINLFTKVIHTILYFNPFVKAFNRLIEKEREKHCDEMVLQFQYDPYGYAAALLVLEKSAQQRHSLALAATGKKGELLTRVEAILGMDKKKSVPVRKLAGVAAALLFLLTVNIILYFGQATHSQQSVREEGMFSQMGSPLFFSDNAPSIAATTIPPGDGMYNVVLEKDPSIHHTIRGGVATAETAQAVSADTDFPVHAMEDHQQPELQFAGLKSLTVPELDKEAEQQVKEALMATKRVAEEIQWKSIEKNIADALTYLEKKEVKEAYLDATAQKVNWGKMEDKLKAAYTEINWETVNAQLEIELAGIRLDSLQQVYTLAFEELVKVQNEMRKAKQESIPDSELNMHTIEQKKKTIDQTLRKLTQLRSKKIIKI